MTIRLQEVMRSEVEGGLSGPANPIPSQSIDCGCGQLPCPKLAKFATRRLFVTLLCCVGLLQAAALAYFYVVGPTIARRFQLNPIYTDWILAVSELTPIIFGLAVAFWGDRFHRASWIGALVLLQCAGYIVVIIPNFTHTIRVIEEAVNVTHMSLHADDSPELCAASASRIVVEEDDTCYIVITVVIVSQVLTGIANIAYYALGMSYLDDNTKKQHVAAFIGVIVAVKVIGVLLGYILAWGCLRLDADNLTVVASYREQIGAWWLGFPILATLLAIPGLLLSWFPRRLPSEVVEQAAASLLNRAGTYNRRRERLSDQKVGSPSFFPTLGRLITNKILICNIFAYIFCVTALTNFMAYENVILESRYQVARPTGLLLGFGDPLPSRLISNIVKPVLIGLILIIVGLVIARARPRVTFIAGYSFIVNVLATAIIFSLLFATCKQPSIVGLTRGSLNLLKYCNKDCRCSKDANFQPVCDNRGLFTFYSPCHAGCTAVEYVDGVKIYNGCSCVQDMTGQGNDEAKDGPCGSVSCQTGWLTFEFGAVLAYALIASTLVGDLMLTLRSVYKQDKAISIGFWLTWVAMFAYVPGRIVYQIVANITCQHWGNQKSVCHLHDSERFGDYMIYLTTLLLVISLLFKIGVWIFSRNMNIYGPTESDPRGNEAVTQELLPVQPKASTEQVQEQLTAITDENINTSEVCRSREGTPATVEVQTTANTQQNSSPQNQEAHTYEEVNRPLKYGPVGPGDRRTSNQDLGKRKEAIRTYDSDDELDSSSDESKKDSSPKVAYKPLDIDSDVESELGSTGPRSRKRVVSKDYDDIAIRIKEFPNPDNYEDPRTIRTAKLGNQQTYDDGSSKTNSFQYAKTDSQKKGDINEVGIPIIDPPFPTSRSDANRNDTRFLKDVKSLIHRYEKNASQEAIDSDQISLRSVGSETRNKLVSGIPLVAMAQIRPQSGLTSSGFGSSRESSLIGRQTPSPKTSHSSTKGSKGALWTDL